jgi:ABC-2 type transport system permease protein
MNFGLKLQWRIAALKNGFRDATAYRVEFLFEIFGSAFVPAAIQAILWYSLFKVGGATEIAGMTYVDMIQYTMVSLLFTQIRGGDHDFELQELIRSGGLSNYLLRPVGLVEFIYIRGAAPRIFLAGLCLAIGCVVGHFYGLSPGRMVGSMFLAFIGNIIHYQIGSILATTGFIWEEAFSILMVKNMVVSFLSGELLPLNMFPAHMQWIWKSTPFYLYVFGPTQYALGKWSHMEYLHQLTIAFAWIIVLSLLIRVTWYFGMKRYASLGG